MEKSEEEVSPVWVDELANMNLDSSTDSETATGTTTASSLTSTTTTSESVSTDGSQTRKSKKEKKAAKLSKAERKAAKKLSKLMQVAARQLEVTLSAEASEWLMVWGIGVDTAMGKKEIQNYFTPKPVEIRLFADQTYFVMKCQSIADAEAFRDKYHGTSFDEKQTLYVGYIDKKSVIPCEDEKLLNPFNEPLPEGLIIYPDFVSAREAELLMKKLYKKQTPENQLKRRVVHPYGFEFRYTTNDVDFLAPLTRNIPSFLEGVITKMMDMEAIPEVPNQLTVNQYTPGQGIPPHCDTHSAFEGPIISMSLGSDVVMDFRQGNKICSVIVPERSLLVMSGPSRLGWAHGITPRKYDIVPDVRNGGITVMPRQLRISCTFRRTSRNTDGCDCIYPKLCDSQKGRLTNEIAPALENDLVHKVYDKISDHFSETRQTPWPRVRKFVLSLEPGSRLLDVGCANGKYFGLRKDIVEVGVDMSIGLLKHCQEKGADVVRANGLCLPFKDCSFDAVISIAVIHHLATWERRLQFIQEMLRVLTPDGVALIYVWSRQQKLDMVQSIWSGRQSDLNVASPPGIMAEHHEEYRFLPIHERDNEFPTNDILVPWVNRQDKQDEVSYRYYHVFDEGELDDLLKDVEGRPIVLHKFYEEGNFVAIIKRRQ